MNLQAKVCESTGCSNARGLLRVEIRPSIHILRFAHVIEDIYCHQGKGKRKPLYQPIQLYQRPRRQRLPPRGHERPGSNTPHLQWLAEPVDNGQVAFDSLNSENIGYYG